MRVAHARAEAQGTSFFYDRRVLRASQQNILYPHIMCLFVVPTVFFLLDSTTILDTFSKDTNWNQIKPLCSPPRGWTFWPVSYTTSRHTLAVLNLVRNDATFLFIGFLGLVVDLTMLRVCSAI